MKLRSTHGISFGYKNNDRGDKIQTELGLSYVNENYENSSGKQEFIAARLLLNLETKNPQTDIVHFWKNKILVSAIKTQDIVINSSVGVRFPFYKNIHGTFQIDIDWDNTPVENNNTTDINYIFVLGYSW